jgi:hypothetical protein
VNWSYVRKEKMENYIIPIVYWKENKYLELTLVRALVIRFMEPRESTCQMPGELNR